MSRREHLRTCWISVGTIRAVSSLQLLLHGNTHGHWHITYQRFSGMKPLTPGGKASEVHPQHYCSDMSDWINCLGECETLGYVGSPITVLHLNNVTEAIAFILICFVDSWEFFLFCGLHLSWSNVTTSPLDTYCKPKAFYNTHVHGAHS